MLELFRAVFAPPRDLILLVAAAWFGLWLVDQRAKQSPISEKAMDALVGAMALAFLIGGRVLYAAAHLSAFISSPASLISLNVGLFDAWGGLAAAALAGAIVMQRERLPAWHTLDLLAPFLAATAVGLALSHLASGAAFGRETNVPWATYLWGAKRHPTQIYELLAGIGTLGAVWSSGTRRPRAGQTFLMWVTLAAASRLAIEGFRGDSTLVLGGLRIAQIIAWFVLAAALLALEIRQVHQAPDAEVVAHEPATTAEIPAPSPREKRKRAAPGKNSAQ